MWSGVARCGNGQQIGHLILYAVRNYVVWCVNKWRDVLGIAYFAKVDVAGPTPVSRCSASGSGIV